MASGQGVSRRPCQQMERSFGVGKTPTRTAVPESEKLGKELARLKRANTRLQRMDKFRVEMTHMVIHDLKGPLAEIIANLNLLEDEALSPVQQEYLGLAILGAEELLRRVQNILEIYRLETKKKMIRHTLFNPLEVIRDVVRGFSTLASMRAITIEVRGPDGPHPLWADRDLFARIVLNLLINAIEHTPSGGRINMDLFLSPDGKRVHLALSDEGPGVKKSRRKRIFQKFSTLHRGMLPGHSGLGLSFCKLAVEAHGGRIWVEDHNGLGSRFEFYLPHGLSAGSDKRRRVRSDGSGR